MGRKMGTLRNASLHQKTLAYWNLSQSARGFGKVVTTGDAIISAGNLLQVLNPGRKVWQCIAELQTAIVDHGRIKKPRKVPTKNVLQLKK